MTLARYWINVPSTLHPMHTYHGTYVLADPSAPDGGPGYTRVYFREGATVSLRWPILYLTPGWPTLR